MPISRLTYASRSADALPQAEIDRILAVSRANNARVGVTGALMYGAREFLQCLEGSREAVNATYGRILRDPRHAEIVILDYREIDRRWFAGWGMHHVPPLWSSRQRLLRYGERETFAPRTMSAASALAMLEDLAHAAPAESGEVEAQVPAVAAPRR
jgi:hypothetical protein